MFLRRSCLGLPRLAAARRRSRRRPRVPRGTDRRRAVASRQDDSASLDATAKLPRGIGRLLAGGAVAAAGVFILPAARGRGASGSGYGNNGGVAAHSQLLEPSRPGSSGVYTIWSSCGCSRSWLLTRSSKSVAVASALLMQPQPQPRSRQRLGTIATCLRRPVAAAAAVPAPSAATAATDSHTAVASALTPQQITHFHTFGFLKIRGLLSPSELQQVGEEFAAGLERKDKNDRIAGQRLQLNWTNLDEHSPSIQALLEDPRFFGAAQQLLGEDCIGFDSNCNFYSGDRSPWHPDVGPELVGLKFTMYLTEVGAESGAL
eukprot:COSAG06_NODE_477_length_15216_cov_133.572402_12_plen_318_part_00